MIKEIFGTLAVILTFVMFVPYIVSILRNRIKPHLFTWVIWSIVTITVGIAQMYNGTVESQIIFYFICHFWYKFLLFLAKYVQYVSKNSQNFSSKLAKN